MTSDLFLLAQASSGGSSLAGLLLPVAMLAGMYVVLIRPQRRRQRAQQDLLATISVGDEVMTVGGIFGRVVGVAEDEGTIEVEIASGVRVRMLRQGVRERIEPPVAEVDRSS